ncbi:hypothetical protein [Aeromonas dhakensis]|uniref:hypothetical protein n=1 Tax=Aeromonas dhakensis TaxID=196024 RepID=UPI0005AA7525|nr:hypothetical protein [Aeromonas dhakensis]
MNHIKAALIAVTTLTALAGCTTPSGRIQQCMMDGGDANTCIALEEARQAPWKALQQSGMQMMAAGQAQAAQEAANRPKQTTCQEQYNGTIQCTTF